MQQRNLHKEFWDLLKGRSILTVDEHTRSEAVWLLKEILENEEDLSPYQYDILIEELADSLIYYFFDGNVPSLLESPKQQVLERLRNEKEKSPDKSWAAIFDQYLSRLWDYLDNKLKEQVARDILDYLDGKYEFWNEDWL